MVLRRKHLDRVLRGKAVVHDHALGEIPLDQHTRELSRHETEKENSKPDKVISIIGGGVRDLLIQMKEIVIAQSLQAEFLGVVNVFPRMQSVAVLGSAQLAGQFKQAGMSVINYVDDQPAKEGGQPRTLIPLDHPDYFTHWGFKE